MTVIAEQNSVNVTADELFCAITYADLETIKQLVASGVDLENRA